jgi:alpha-tubulin suppressor-like RCC1 family protein
MNKIIQKLFIIITLLMATFTVAHAGGGHSHHVLVRPDGSMWSWGANDFGQLGTGNYSPSTSPVEIGSGNVWTQVSRGQFHNIALDEFGRVWTWGANQKGQLGLGHNEDKNLPTLISGSIGYKQVAAGSYHSFAITKIGALKSWGSNNVGQLGDTTTTDRNSPIVVDTNYESVSAGASHSLGLKTDGTLWAWGSNGYGQLGTGGASLLFPSQVGGDNDWTDISAGLGHSLALKASGNAYSWGKNFSGQLGKGNTDNVNAVSFSGPGILKASSGAKHTMLLSSGFFGAMGSNAFRQVGQGSEDSIVTNPTPVDFGNWRAVDAGEYHNIVESGNGEIYSFGRNNKGQTGVGYLSESSPLTNVFGPMSRFKNEYSLKFSEGEYIDIGDYHNFERTDSFSLAAWFRTTDTGGGTFVAKLASSGSAGYMFYITVGKIGFQLQNTFGSDGIHLHTPTSHEFNDNEWHFSVLTFSGNSNANGVKVYVDGKLMEGIVVIDNNLSATTLNSASLQLGAYTNGSTTPFFGGLDDVSIWNKELNISEVNDLYNDGLPIDLSSHLASANLLGWWRMGDSDTYPTIKDQSGQNNDGTMTNMSGNTIIPTYPGFNKNAVSFDGIDDGINLGNKYAFDSTDSFTTSIWVKTSATGTTRTLFRNTEPGPTYTGWLLRFENSGALSFLLVADMGSTDVLNLVSPATYDDNQWHHVTVVYSGNKSASGVTLYVDGVNASLNVTTDSLVGSTVSSANMILGNEVLASNYFDGLLDEASIWNKALTPAEVSTVYSGNTQIDLKKTSMSANLVGWWRMGDGDSYPTIKDHSYNRYDGTMTNMSDTNIIDLNKPESFIYYVDKANDGSNIEHITKVNLDGSGNHYIFNSPAFAVQNFGSYLNATDDYFYWVQKSNNGSSTDMINRMALDGSSNINVFISPPFGMQDFGSYLNVTDTHLYWVSKSNDGSSTDVITRAPLDGSSNINIFSSPPFGMQNFGSYLNVTDTHLYWVSKSNDGSNTDVITRAPIDGSSNINIFTSPSFAVQDFGSYLNVTDQYMYWVQKSNDGSSTDMIVRAPIDGSSNINIFTSPGNAVQNFGSYLNVTDTHMYWIQKSNDGNNIDQLVRANLDGSGNTVILSSPGFAVQNFGNHLIVK